MYTYKKILNSTFINAVHREMHHLEMNSGGELTVDRYEREDDNIAWIKFACEGKAYDMTVDVEYRDDADEDHYLQVVIEGTDHEEVVDLDDVLRSIWIAPEEDELDAFHQIVRETIRKQVTKLYTQGEAQE